MGAPGSAEEEAAERERSRTSHGRVGRGTGPSLFTEHVLPMSKSVLVVGGGVPGVNAALALADQGLKVYLVEKSGPGRRGNCGLRRTSGRRGCPRPPQPDSSERTLHQSRIQVLTRSVIVDRGGGIPGLFKTGLGDSAPRCFTDRLRTASPFWPRARSRTGLRNTCWTNTTPL